MVSNSIITTSIRVLVVDDSAFLIKHVIHVLEDDPKIQIVGQCSDGDEVCPFLSLNKVDIILMDISMERMNGDVATREVKKLFPNVKVIAYSSHHHETYRVHMINCGVKGYVFKSTNLKTVIEIIKSVHSNGDFKFL